MRERQQRPWCVRCRQEDGSEAWAAMLGVACEWHWGILSPESQTALRAEILKKHPRGGRVSMVTEQLWVIARAEGVRGEWVAFRKRELAEMETA
jgi:hypothetical protein